MLIRTLTLLTALGVSGAASADVSRTVTPMPDGGVHKVWKNGSGSRMSFRRLGNGIVVLTSPSHVIKSYVDAPTAARSLSQRGKPVLRVSQDMERDIMRLQVEGGPDEIF